MVSTNILFELELSTAAAEYEPARVSLDTMIQDIQENV